MPITQSAKKALRQNKRRRARNLAQMKAVKDTVKQYKRLLGSNREKATAFLSTLYKRVDKLAKSGYIKRNRAARMKSRMARKLGKR